MTYTTPPDEREQEAPGPQIADGSDRSDANIVLSQNDDHRLALHVGKDLKADVLDLSLKATPPGKYVSRSAGGRIGWSDEPQYFSFNKINHSKGVSVYILEESGVGTRIPFESIVELASVDGFLAADAVWKIRPAANVFRRYGYLTAALLLLGFGLMGVVAWKFAPISDFACDRWSICLADQVGLQQVKSCSKQTAACDQATCIKEFRVQFPASRFIPVIENIEKEGAETCRAADEQQFAGVSHCVQEKINTDSCNVHTCFAGYDMTKTSERVSQARTIMAVAAERCRLVTSTPATKQEQAPAPTAAPPPAPVSAQPVLSDGPHRATQQYTGPRSRADPQNCPASASFVVDVSGGNFTYSRPDFFDGALITRTWVGTIDQTTGQIAILGSKGTPPTKNAMTVVGAFDGATVLSDFCGSGRFMIEP